MAIVIFFLGLIFGSFANVIILRLNTGESLIFKDSRCFFCSQKLQWFELIPVASFLVLRGRCRSCKSRISWQYPAVEFASGFLFLLIYVSTTTPINIWSLGLATAFFWLLLVISVYDIRHKIIPNSLVYLVVAIAFLSLIVGQQLAQNLISGIALFSFFAFLWWVSKGQWMGFGDAKLALAIGIFLGWPLSLVGVLVSFWVGALFGLVLIFLRRLHLKTHVPFGPFLSIGALTAFLWGERIIEWYLSLL
ncbi:prepilin peptidase [Patescibacteria group bacterium]|nr:prepilin peptidase [Patescibacteria group bacterium]